METKSNTGLVVVVTLLVVAVAGLIGFIAYDKFLKEELTVSLSNTCLYQSGTAGEVGAKYTCNFGDRDRTFYVLETGKNPVSNSILKENEVALILEGNYDITTQSWCKDEPDTACQADGLEAKLDAIVRVWTKLDKKQVGLPSAEQIVAADGKKEDSYLHLEFPGVLKLTNQWLYSYPDYPQWNDEYNHTNSYWLSTPSTKNAAWAVRVQYGQAEMIEIYVGGRNTESDTGVRPVVTLPI